MLTSLQNIEQFNSLAKLNLKNNLLKSIQELGHLANLDHLELLSVEGNPFQEDERYIQKFVATTLRNIKRLDIKSKNQPNEYLVMSSPSQATTGGAGGYSTSLQNIPDLMKELSNFSNSNTRQNPSGITSAITHQQQPLQKLNTNQFPANSLINAKIGKNNVKSRRDSNEEDKKESGHHKDRKESQTAIHANIKDDFLDSFDMLNLSSDQNMIDINLKQCRDLQTRMTNNLKGINSHCQILSNGSQERDSQLNSTNNNYNQHQNGVGSIKMEIQENNFFKQTDKKDILGNLQNIALSNQNSRNQLQGMSSIGLSRQYSQQTISHETGSNNQQQFLQRIISHQQNPSSSESERSSVKSITTINSSSRHSNNHQIPKPTNSRNNNILMTTTTQRSNSGMMFTSYHQQVNQGDGSLTDRGGSINAVNTNNNNHRQSAGPFELKKSSSQMQVKLKRQSINFLQNENSSRNSTVRGSLLMRNDSSTILMQNNGSLTNRDINLFTTMQNRPVSAVNQHIQIINQTSEGRDGFQLIKMADKFIIDNFQRKQFKSKQHYFKNWLNQYRFRNLMRKQGLQIYTSLTKVDQHLSKRALSLKHVSMQLWKNYLAKARFQEQVTPKFVNSIRKYILATVLSKIKNAQIHNQITKRLSAGQPSSKLGHFNSLNKEMNNLLNSVGGVIPSGFATQRSRVYDGVIQDSILQEIIKENVQKTLNQEKPQLQQKQRTRNSGMSNQNSNTLFNTAGSIDRKTTQGGSTNNNSVTHNNSSTKKKKVGAPFTSNNQSRNAKHSQNSTTLSGLQQNSDKKAKLHTQVLKKSASGATLQQQNLNQNSIQSSQYSSQQQQLSQNQLGFSQSQQSLYKMFTTTSTTQRQNLLTERPQSANLKQTSITNTSNNIVRRAQMINQVQQNESKLSLSKSRITSKQETKQNSSNKSTAAQQIQRLVKNSSAHQIHQLVNPNNASHNNYLSSHQSKNAQNILNSIINSHNTQNNNPGSLSARNQQKPASAGNNINFQSKQQPSHDQSSERLRNAAIPGNKNSKMIQNYVRPYSSSGFNGDSQITSTFDYRKPQSQMDQHQNQYEEELEDNSAIVISAASNYNGSKTSRSIDKNAIKIVKNLNTQIGIQQKHQQHPLPYQMNSMMNGQQQQHYSQTQYLSQK
eukprot:403344549